MKILIVDDNPDDRRLLRYMIEQNRHEAVEAVDGFDGLKMARDGAPDLIISDALMPVMDGFQFLRELKQDPALREIPFIFYSSSYKDYQDVRLAMSLGADAYFLKPVDPVELWEKIDSLLAKDREKTVPPVAPVREDEEYLKQYSAVVAAKLEDKVRELELALEERKRAEAALRESETFIRNVLESVGEGFIVVDRDFRILSANRAFCDLVGLPQQDVIGRPCYEVAHRVDRPCDEAGEHCPVRETFASRLPACETHTHLTSTGEKQYVEINSYPFLDETGEVRSVIETINDVTARKQLEDQLRQAQKMEAIGTLAGGVAHDFNNILTAITGYAGIMKMKMTPDDPQRAVVDQILAASQRAAQLTRGLLAFSRKQVIEPRPLDVNEVIKSIEKLLRRLIGEDIELTTSYEEGSLMIMADAGQLEQVLMNLATNARDAMPSGGRLSIATQKSACDAGGAGIRGPGKPGPYAQVIVSDSGVGMDEATRGKIFDPFFTTKEPGKGTGLGLAIVYGIVQQHAGTISVSSEPGKGTTFTISLPLIAVAAGERHAEPVAPPRGGTETILLAEDDREVRTLLSTVLADSGYRVLEANDGLEAAAIFAAHAREIDLLILDVVMPKKSGREVYDSVKAMRPDVRVLFISGYTADILHLKGIGGEAFQYLEKPIGPLALLHKVREILDAQQAVGWLPGGY